VGNEAKDWARILSGFRTENWAAAEVLRVITNLLRRHAKGLEDHWMDFAQDIFGAILKSRMDEKLASADALVTYLTRTVINRVNQHLRDQVRKGKSPPKVDEVDDLDNGRQASKLERTIWQFVSMLPSAVRLVIEAKFREDLTHAEIASKLRIPIGTVHTRAYVGVNELRRLVLDCDVRDEVERKFGG